MIFQHHRFQIHNQSQHPYSHSLSDFNYTNPALPEGVVTNLEGAMNWLFAVLYPHTQPAVANVAALPPAGNTLNDYRVVDDDGDGKSAGYRWEQREGEAVASWHKIADMDWGEDSVISGFIDKTLDVYVKRAGYDDLDDAGDPYTGDIAGQRVYGGASPNTHLTLYANSGDGTGPNTGFLNFGDNARPLVDSQFSMGTAAYRFSNVFSDVVTAGTAIITGGSITDTTGAIDFGDEDLSTSGTITTGTMLLGSGSITDTSGAISFGDENLTTTGTMNANIFAGPTGNITTLNSTTGNITSLVSTNITMTGTAGVVKSTLGVFSASLLVDADVSATAGILLTKLGAITASRATETDIAGKIVASAITSAELNNLDGSTSNIQTQLDGKASTTLDNLGATAINASLLPGTDLSISLGSTTKRWLNAYINTYRDQTGVVIESTTLKKFSNSATGLVDGAGLFYNIATDKWEPSIIDLEVDHGSISGLGDDDHAQYALLVGRSGGQTITGGTDPGDLLRLTSSATGLVVFDRSFLPGTDNSLDIGAVASTVKDIYTSGQAYGLRLQGGAALPSASALRVGRLFYDTTVQGVYVDKGGTWAPVGSPKVNIASVWNGVETSKIITVSPIITDATSAVIQFRDTAANNYEVMYPDITTTATAVTVTFAIAPPAGTYKLIGIQ